MHTVQLLGTLVPLSLTSGINLYATVLVIGLCIRFNVVTDFPDGLTPLASWPVLTVAAIFYLAEFLADKIPVFENIWDIIHTFIRPVGAAALAFFAVTSVDPTIAVVAAMAAGGIALVSHGGKATVRLMKNTVAPEPVSSAGISLMEDFGVAALTVLALKLWWLALILSLILLAALIFLLPRIVQWLFFIIRAVSARIRATGWKVKEPDHLPEYHLDAIRQEMPDISAKCLSQGIKRVGSRAGYLSLLKAEDEKKARNEREFSQKLGGFLKVSCS